MATRVAAPAEQTVERIHVLHVDDEPDMLDVTKSLLERESEAITVRSERSPTAALDLLDDVDCVVSDYSMAEMDGVQFLEKVRESHPDLPFILFTGKGTEEVAADAIFAGVTDYVQKGGPDVYLLLVTHIERFVEKYRTERDIERRIKAMETAREGISLLDADGRFIYVNRAYAEMYGYTPAEMRGQHWEILYPEEDVQEVYDDILPAVPKRGRWDGQNVHLRKDGTPLLTSHGLSYADNETLICVTRDITEETVIERRLAEERERFDLLVEAITDYAIFGLDSGGYLTSWNTGAERLTGYTQSDIEGTHLATLFGDDDGETTLSAQLLDRAIAEGSVREEGWLLRRDGSRYWADITLTRLDSDDEADRGFASVVRDMTEQMRYERQLQQRIEQLNQFASVLSHDLRNPLSTAVLSLELARQEAPATSDHLDRAGRALERINDLIESLLLLAREGQVVREFEAVSLASCAERAWDLIDAPDATLVVGPDIDGVDGDGERLQTLFENLFRNAVEHVDSTVTVRVGSLDGGFFVEDDGPGISPEERERVFEYGYTTGDCGSGFGLAIVESIAAAHGWDVAVTDGSTDGARFEFTTPTAL